MAETDRGENKSTEEELQQKVRSSLENILFDLRIRDSTGHPADIRDLVIGHSYDIVENPVHSERLYELSRAVLELFERKSLQPGIDPLKPPRPSSFPDLPAVIEVPINQLPDLLRPK